MSGRLVIGVGNPNCGDDAVGPMVARLLLGRVPGGVTVLERAGDMLGLIEDWAGRDSVILIDAAARVSAAGTIHRIDLLRDPLPPGLALASTHAFGVADSVALARTLGRLPGGMVLYAVEGEAFEPGSKPDEAVVSAAAVVAGLVAAELGLVADSLHRPLQV